MYQPKLPKDLRCPLEFALEFFSGRWKSRILCLLYSENSAGFGDNVGQAIAVYAEGDNLTFKNCGGYKGTFRYGEGCA